MPRNASGVYTPPAGQPVVTGTTISSSVFNSLVTDLSSAMTQSVNVSGSAPMLASLNMGNQSIINLLNPTSPQMAATKAYVDAAALMPSYVSQAFRNRIINAAMNIDQRNSGASGTSIGYTVDRWYYNATQASQFTWQQDLNAITPPSGFVNVLGFNSNQAYGVLSSDYFIVDQPIEASTVFDYGFGTVNPKSFSLTFWANANITGTYGGSVTNYARTRSYPFSYSLVANNWTQISIAIPGDTGGSWVNGFTPAGAMHLTFCLGAGSTYLSSLGTWQTGNFVGLTGSQSLAATNGAMIWFTGVQLEASAVATPFEVLPFTLETLRCLRYYAVGFPSGGAGNSVYSGNVTSGSSYTAQTFFPVRMRAAPSMTLTNVSNNGFSSSVGTTTSTLTGFGETRTSNATTNGGSWVSSWVASAEL